MKRTNHICFQQHDSHATTESINTDVKPIEMVAGDPAVSVVDDDERENGPGDVFCGPEPKGFGGGDRTDHQSVG